MLRSGRGWLSNAVEETEYACTSSVDDRPLEPGQLLSTLPPRNLICSGIGEIEDVLLRRTEGESPSIRRSVELILALRGGGDASFPGVDFFP